jgi:hypothetical protein
VQASYLPQRVACSAAEARQAWPSHLSHSWPAEEEEPLERVPVLEEVP